VLNVIPIFFLFFEVVDEGVSKVVCIKKEFLWSGVRDDAKNCWELWRTVYQRKKYGD